MAPHSHRSRDVHALAGKRIVQLHEEALGHDAALTI